MSGDLLVCKISSTWSHITFMTEDGKIGTVSVISKTGNVSFVNSSFLAKDFNFSNGTDYKQFAFRDRELYDVGKSKLSLTTNLPICCCLTSGDLCLVICTTEEKHVRKMRTCLHVEGTMIFI